MQRLNLFMLVAIVAMLLPPRARAQAPAQPAAPDAAQNAAEDARDFQDSCQGFVQDFYNWYVAALNGDTFMAKRDATWVRAVRIRSTAFSHDVVQGIEQDGKMQAKHPGKDVGLDFDPFLATRDRDDRYTPGTVTITGKTCRAEIFGILHGEKLADPAVSAELAFDGKQWSFTNFYYPKTLKKSASGDDLLSVLKALRETHNH